MKDLNRFVAAVRSKKCLVLDLDNTLWHGVAGEDEVIPHHIYIEYIKKLQNNGVIIATCSQNDEAIAKKVFDKLVGMEVLFVANWNDKVTNLRYIAKTLNIGLDSIVFVDDDPRQRDLVSRYLPEIAVVTTIEELKDKDYFPEALTREDRERARYYTQMQRAKQEETKFEDMAEFIESLELEYTICHKDIPYDRVVQLFDRCGQFNMTQKKYTKKDLMRIANKHLVIYCQLKDKFGDYGVISAMVGVHSPPKLIIANWVVSCRALNRNVELKMLDYIKDFPQIWGIYKPTNKNALIKDLYKNMGFKRKDNIWTYTKSSKTYSEMSLKAPR